ncbi:asparagine synthase (glutamine-hydrolyzing) [Novipirellula artificiosorum]|uniref:asparagine synthase (glutamine-hydrolyzing) n=1 Tax=Novipirellula artificiosorum TaxID=2528016 RepID=A0A5C6D073_9BACT|nr:asparagine synthase (glutamine-hydrolyzing) [Novipirellula artificiosorum]TWU29157.1 Asparagine synthetase [glutamine-hydrolyzing] 1 [Novipirellula artificiosorum]
MCGITGAVWLPNSPPVDSADFDRMTDTLAHRGPDGRGVYRDDFDDGSGVLLGHRRLSIIDLGGGAQPMCNEDESVWISFNGEIYNYRELRPGLEQQGHRFRTNSDTETIVHLYEQYGDDFVTHLRGMFAIAIWDKRRRRLVLARDRLGQKPLVYCHQADRLLFASEIKAIKAISHVPLRIRNQAVDEYLTYGYIPHPGTIYDSIQKLPPAHIAVFESGRLTTSCYWNPELCPDETASTLELQEQLTCVLSDSVRLRMRSDVPLGAFLSGGIDSTIITGLMQKHAAQPTNTYTIGFPVDEFDETEYAHAAAEYLKTNHCAMEVTPNSLDLLEKLVWLFDEPYSDSSAVPTYYLSQMTRQHVKVSLTGDGGDELFAGYDRYQTVDRLRYFDRLPRPMKALLTGPWRYLIPGGGQKTVRQRLKHRLDILREPADQRYAQWLTGFPPSRRDSLYRPEFRDQVSADASLSFVANLMRRSSSLTPGMQAMRTDLRSYLPCDLLSKVDITSMAHGLECRSPFLDHHVVELAGRFSFAALSQPGKIKPMLTQTFLEMIPPSLRRRPKMGFSVPLDRWFRDDLKGFAREMLMSSDAFCHSFFEPSAVESILHEHQAGHWGHGDRIWSLLFLELWGRNT